METTPSASPRSAGYRVLVIAAAILAIVGSGIWIYRTEFAAPGVNVELHKSVGQVLAEETAHAVGHVGNVLLITMDTRHAPELKLQMQAFEKHLKQLGGITIKDRIVLDPGDNPKYRPGSGLSEKRFLKIVRKSHGVDAIVSFVGAPEIADQALAQMKVCPKFIAETHSPEKLVNLIEKKVLLVAVVPRFEFPAPGPRKPETMRQWFDHYFQVVSADSALPKPDEAP